LYERNCSNELIHICFYFQQFVQHLERDAGATDGSARQAIQSEAIQAGILMQHLGAMLLELGRTTMTLRMGSSPVCHCHIIYICEFNFAYLGYRE
jgi:hypothetical protein